MGLDMRLCVCAYVLYSCMHACACMYVCMYVTRKERLSFGVVFFFADR